MQEAHKETSPTYHTTNATRHKTSAPGQEIGASRKKTDALVQETVRSEDIKTKSMPRQTWHTVQKKIKDTVVQVFVETTPFNWAEPFKSPDQDKSCGTGFFIDHEGHIVSNFHVIEDAVRITIQIPSFGKQLFNCKIVGVCPERDISLLKLSDESRKKIACKLGKLPFLALGDSDNVMRTEKIMALGYPLGQEKLKSTQGIISGRENLGGESFFQITAALNPGNSGGPSINSRGDVIGINTARISTAQNVGYIIPINDVKSVIYDLHKIRFLRKPFFGCTFNYGNTTMVSYLKNPLPEEGGLYIARVFKNSLFDKAGVKEGDMIYKINDYRLDLYGETTAGWSEDKIPLQSLLNRFEIGQQISVELYRRGEFMKKQFVFGLSDQLPIRKRYADFEPVPYEIFGGMVFMELALNHLTLFEEGNPKLSRFNFQENLYTSRIILTHVFSGSCAHEARVVTAGDLIKEINGLPVATLTEVRQALSKSNRFFTVKNEEHQFMVLDTKKLLDEEAVIAERYHYKSSDVIQALRNKISVS